MSTSYYYTRRCWTNMKQRCNNKNHPQYKDYGGRGITYDPRWEKFKGFFEGMGEKPFHLTLERVDNNGNYCKINCKWATRKEQALNKREAVRVGNNPRRGVTWQKDKRSKNGGQWRAYGNRRVHGKSITLYGADLNIAIEARKFYEEFILGECRDD